MAILVFSPNGTYKTKSTLEEARTSADCAGKTVVVTSALTAAQSDITAAWPADRALKVKKGGMITNSAAFVFSSGASFSAGLYQVFAGAGAVSGLNTADPYHFGAKGDYSTDDTAAVRKAWLASKHLCISTGGFIVDGSDTGILLTIGQSGVSITGRGVGASSLIAKTGSNGFTFIKSDGLAREMITVSGVSFYGGSSRGIGNDYGVWLKNVQFGLIEKCSFQGLAGGAGMATVASAGSKDIMIRNNHFVANNGEDINFYGSEGSVFRVSAIGNTHYQPQAVAIEVEGRNGTTVAGYEVYDVVISGNTIRSDDPLYSSCGDHGILIIGGRGVSVSNNSINRRGTDGIHVIGTWNASITGNIIQDMGATGRKGINLTQDLFAATGVSINVVVSNNVIDNANGSGIAAYAGENPLYVSQNITITDNITTTCGTGIAVDNIQTLTLSGNSYRNDGAKLGIGSAVSGDIVIDDIGNTSALLNVPYVNSQTIITQSVAGTLTLPLASGYNSFVVYLNANVTAVNFTGQEKLGQKVRILFLQAAGSITVTTTQSTWTTNGNPYVLFAGLAVPSLPGSTIAGRWGVIDFEFITAAGGLPANGRWIMTNYQGNVGG